MIGPRAFAVVAVAVVALVAVPRGGSQRPSSAKVTAEPVWPVIKAEHASSSTVVTPSAVSLTSVAEAGVQERDSGAREAAGEEEAFGPADRWRVLLGSDAPRAGLYRLIGDPASSDLPPAVAARAASTGSVFVVADVTGVGREAFPGWWAGLPAVPVAATARVLAAGAAWFGPLVQVVVVWDGTAPDGGVLGERATTVLLESTTSTGFVPVHPGAR